MRGLILFTLAVILVHIPKAEAGKSRWNGWGVDPAIAARARGSDPDVAAIEDQPGDPPIPQEELHLTPAEVAAVGNPAEVAKVEAEDKKDEVVEDKEAKEEKEEIAAEKLDEEEAIIESKNKAMPPAEKEKHKEVREAHHKNYKAHHAERIQDLMNRVVDRIFRHEAARHHEV